MRALVVDPAAPERLALGEAPDPTPAPHEALVRVAAVSLNYGELPANGGGEAGFVPGWDAAGVVEHPAADGSGPSVGTRVLTFAGSGGWAALRAAPTADLAAVPDGVDLGLASALPVAGVTALRALRKLGPLLGRRVVVTSAAGGVGRFAVQLAHFAGAHVVAVVGSAARGEGLQAVGADEVAVGIEAVEGPVFGVIENVGGPTLVRSFQLLEEGGSVISIGGVGGDAAVFPPYGTVGPHRSLVSFTMGGTLAADLAFLLSLLRAGTLHVQVGWRGPWTQAAEASRALRERRVLGKAVLDVA